MKHTLPAFVICVFLLAACGRPAEIPLPTSTADNSQLARAALTGFFAALDRGDYAAADALYGGDYETLTTMNPDLAADDHAALWKQGCQFNGLVCMQVKEIVSSEQADENTFRLVVHFENADGSLFVQGPCCGEDETSAPPVSEFTYDVKRGPSGGFRVMGMPPYVP